MPPRRLHVLLPAVGLFSAALVGARPAESAHLKAKPALRLRPTYDSNIFDSPESRVSDYVLRAYPNLTLTLEGWETSIRLSGGVVAEWYEQNPERNEADTAVNIALEPEDPLRITRFLTIRPVLGVSESQDSVVRVEQIGPGEADLPAQEIVFTERTRVRDTRGAVEVGYRATERTTLSAGGGISSRDHLEDPAGRGDSHSYSAHARARFGITPRMDGGLVVRGTVVGGEDLPDSRIFFGGIGVGYRVDPHRGLDGNFGASYSRRENDGGTAQTEWSPSFRLALDYRWKNFRANAGAGLELAGVSAFGGVGRRATARIRLDHRFARKWTWDLTLLFQRNRSLEEPAAEDVRTGSVAAGIRFEPADWVSVRLGGTAVRQRADGASAEDLERNTVFLELDFHKEFAVF